MEREGAGRGSAPLVVLGCDKKSMKSKMLVIDMLIWYSKKFAGDNLVFNF